MSVLVFSDLHAHDWTLFGGITKYRGHAINARLADAAKVIDWVRRKAQKHDVRRVLFLGDLFHKKCLIDVRVFGVVAEALYRLAEAFPLTVLAGNHDLTRRSAEGQFSDEHALAALGGHPRIQVVDQPTLVDGLGMVPYAADRDTVLRGVETCISAGATALALHAGVAGAVTGPVEYQPFEPVTTDDLPNVPIVSGHYHLPQVVGGRVTYIGAPLELVRGDGGAAPTSGERCCSTTGGASASACATGGRNFSVVVASRMRLRCWATSWTWWHRAVWRPSGWWRPTHGPARGPSIRSLSMPRRPRQRG